MGAVGVPVVREEADFGLAGGDDALQAGLLGRVAHVIQHPVQQLLIGASKVGLVPLEDLAEPHFPLPRIHHAGVVVLQEGLGRRTQLAVDVLRGVRFNGRAALRSTVQGKVNEGLGIGESHLKPRVGFGEGSEKLRDAFPVPPQHAVLNVLQSKNLSSNQVAHVVEESVSLPHVGGGPHPQVAVDDQCVVDVDEEGQLLLAAQRQQLHPLQLDGQLAVALEVGVLRHAFVVYRLAVSRQVLREQLQDHFP